MNREIKFRAWDKVNNIMFHNVHNGITFDDDSHYKFRDFLEDKDRWVIMQYTGLKDKNGVEIYEGDRYIVQNYYEDEDQDAEKYVVTYDSFADCCVSGWGYSFGSDGCPADIEQVLVIGNIHEQKELLNS